MHRFNVSMFQFRFNCRYGRLLHLKKKLKLEKLKVALEFRRRLNMLDRGDGWVESGDGGVGVGKWEEGMGCWKLLETGGGCVVAEGRDGDGNWCRGRFETVGDGVGG